MPRRWVQRRDDLVKIAERYLSDPLSQRRTFTCRYDDILEQRAWFSPDALIAQGGIERAMLACDALFHERCGFKWVLDLDHQVIIRELPAGPLPAPKSTLPQGGDSDLDFNKEHFVSQALGLLEASFHYIDRALPVLYSGSSAHVFGECFLRQFKRDLVSLLTGFAYLAKLHDQKSELSSYFYTFCEQVINRLKHLVGDEGSDSVQAWVKTVGPYSVKKSLQNLRTLAPLSYQPYDVVTLDLSLGIYTAQIAMAQPEIRQYIEFAVVLLYEESTSDTFIPYSAERLGQKIIEKICKYRPQSLSLEEIRQIEHCICESYSKPGCSRIYGWLPAWYHMASKVQQQTILPHLKNLLKQDRWIIPGHYGNILSSYPLLPPQNYFLYEFGVIDSDQLCFSVYNRAHATLLTQGSAYQAKANLRVAFEDAKAIQRKLSLEMLLSSGSQSNFLIREEEKMSAASHVLANFVAQHNEKHLEESEKIRLRRFTLDEENVDQVFGYMPHKAAENSISALGRYLFSKSCPWPSNFAQSIGYFLIAGAQSAADQYFWTVRGKLRIAVHALHQMKRGFLGQRIACTQEQILLLEAAIAYKILEINQYHQKHHTLSNWDQKFFSSPGLNTVIDHVPLPSVLELVSGGAIGVHYDHWRVVIAGILDCFAGAFQGHSFSKLCLTQCHAGQDAVGSVLESDKLLQALYQTRFKKFLSCSDESTAYFGLLPTIVHAVSEDFQEQAGGANLAVANERLGHHLRHAKSVAAQFEADKKEFLCLQDRIASTSEMAFMAGYSGGTRGCVGLVAKVGRFLSAALPYFYKLFFKMARLHRVIKQSNQQMPELLAASTFHHEFAELAQLLRPKEYRRITAMSLYRCVLDKIARSEKKVATSLIKKVALEIAFNQIKGSLCFYEYVQLYQLLHGRSTFTHKEGEVGRLLSQPLCERDRFQAREALVPHKKYRALSGLGDKIQKELREILLREILGARHESLAAFLKAKQHMLKPESPHLQGLSPALIYSIFEPYPGQMEKIVRRFPELKLEGWVDGRSFWQRMVGQEKLRPAVEGFISLA